MVDLPVTLYTPASPLREPKRLLREMLHDLATSRELAWRLFIRDISSQYRQSLLGYVWILIPPIVAAVPFVYLNEHGVMKLDATPIPYGAFAAIGTIIWQVFVDALNAPLKTVTSARPMLTRINLPREAILLSALAQVVFGFLVRLALLAAVLAWYRLIPASTALLFPLGALSLLLTGFVAGVLITPLGLLYTDVQQSLPVFTTLLLLLTPVLYPAPASGLAASVIALNPLTPLITATRDWLVIGHTSHAGALFIIGAAAAVLLLAGWIIFRIAMPHLIARVGN